MTDMINSIQCSCHFPFHKFGKYTWIDKLLGTSKLINDDKLSSRDKCQNNMHYAKFVLWDKEACS